MNPPGAFNKFPQLLESLLARGVKVPLSVVAEHFASPLGHAAAAALLSLLIVLVAGSVLIPWLRRRMIAPGQSASPTLNALHEHKQATPTMGGLFVLLGLVVALLVCADLRQANVQGAIGLGLGLALLGGIDDLKKLGGARRGLSARQKLAGQLLLALCAAGWLRGTASGVPTVGAWQIAGIDFAFLATVLWIVGASNAANLTDGLDGLAAGCMLWATAAVGLIIYCDLRGTSPWPAGASDSNRAELLVLAGALFGSVLGFLKFNRRPARVFLGDTGSLPLGGLLGLLALGSGNALACSVVGGVFVAELASVGLQIAWYKCSGRRLFRCAPLHHHFQFLGWNESQIVRRFCAAAAVCAILGIALGLNHASAKQSAITTAVGSPPSVGGGN